MKQGRQYRNLILWIFLAAVVVYFAVAVVSSVYDPLTTATAVEYEAGSGCYTTGYVVRQETLIHSDYGITVLSAAEGSRVIAGGSVATGYLTSGAQERQGRIEELRSKLSQLDYAGQDSGSVSDQAALDTQISDDLLSMSRYLCKRDMNSLSALSPELKGLVLRRCTDDSDRSVLEAQRIALQAELDTLTGEADTDTKPITVSVAGYFSAVADGYENLLTPETLQTMSVQTYESLTAEEIPENTIGKLIQGNKWYYVTVIPATQIPELSEGDTVRLTFARDFSGEIEMNVERVGKSEAGYKLLVLSSKRFMQDVTLLRDQSAELAFQTYSGLRVPKEAVHVDENGRTGVFVLEGAIAKWKYITLLSDNGESYVVMMDKSSTDNLWPGDEIIIHAKNLYNGKVVG